MAVVQMEDVRSVEAAGALVLNDHHDAFVVQRTAFGSPVRSAAAERMLGHAGVATAGSARSRSASAAVSGRANRYPWAYSQPRLFSTSSWARFSTPSAMVRIPRRRASSITVRTMAACLG